MVAGSVDALGRAGTVASLLSALQREQRVLRDSCLRDYLNQPDHYGPGHGNSPLHIACLHGSVDVVQRLVSQGDLVHVGATNAQGLTPGDLAATWEKHGAAGALGARDPRTNAAWPEDAGARHAAQGALFVTIRRHLHEHATRRPGTPSTLSAPAATRVGSPRLCARTSADTVATGVGVRRTRGVLRRNEATQETAARGLQALAKARRALKLPRLPRRSSSGARRALFGD